MEVFDKIMNIMWLIMFTIAYAIEIVNQITTREWQWQIAAVIVTIMGLILLMVQWLEIREFMAAWTPPA